MKKIIALLLAALMLVSLTACKAKEPEKEAESSALADLVPEAEAAAQAQADTQTETPAAEAAEPAADAEPVVTPEDLLGSWILSEENDPEALEAAFPGAKEQGGAMQLGADGLIFWTIGTTGGAGSFTVDGDTLKGQIYLDYNGTPQDMTCTVERDASPVELTMVIGDTEVIWVLD